MLFICHREADEKLNNKLEIIKLAIYFDMINDGLIIIFLI
jgi:hypothetical protein